MEHIIPGRVQMLGGPAEGIVVLRVEDDRVAADQSEVVGELLGRCILSALELTAHRAKVHWVGDHGAVRGLRVLVDWLRKPAQRIEPRELIERVLEAPIQRAALAVTAAVHLGTGWYVEVDPSYTRRRRRRHRLALLLGRPPGRAGRAGRRAHHRRRGEWRSVGATSGLGRVSRAGAGASLDELVDDRRRQGPARTLGAQHAAAVRWPPLQRARAPAAILDGVRAPYAEQLPLAPARLMSPWALERSSGSFDRPVASKL